MVFVPPSPPSIIPENVAPLVANLTVLLPEPPMIAVVLAPATMVYFPSVVETVPSVLTVMVRLPFRLAKLSVPDESETVSCLPESITTILLKSLTP